uniref:SMP-LTD domain-containing protein n=1 Tax=Biomphalaria glabrata TaxID=6526 RepID=A0A2C9KUM8_BIOGL
MSSIFQATDFLGLYPVTGISLFLSWILGSYNFSYVWIIFLIVAFSLFLKVRNYAKFKELFGNSRDGSVQQETLKWVNFILNKWFVFSSDYLNQVLMTSIDTRLKKAKLTYVENLNIISCQLGTQTPELTNLRVSEIKNPYFQWFHDLKSFSHLQLVQLFPSYQVKVEAAVTLNSKDLKIKLHGHFLTPFFDMDTDVLLEGLSLHGNIQIILSLSKEIPFPHISKATFCFTERPKLNFNVYIWTYLNLMKMPFISSEIHNSLMAELSRQVISPASLDIDLGSFLS